jgi:hypothetical protein
MKKIHVLISIVLLTSWVYPADFKIMAGLSLSKSTEPLYVDGGLDTYSLQAEYGVGFAAGGGIEFSLTRNLALEADALFIQKSSRLRIEEMGMPVGHSMARISELSIPVLVKVLLKPGNSPYILGGGEFAFVLTEGPKKIDYGLVGGFGYRKQLKRFSMSLEARYHHGLQDMLPDEVIFPGASSRLRKMRAFVFMVGFTI